MERVEIVNGLKVTAKPWVKGPRQQRLYFSVEGNRGQACWDLISNNWIKVHGEVGSRFKIAIKAAFGLERKLT